MDITLSCNLSLSKKLRALIGNSETAIRILSGVLVDGKAQADITLSVDSVSKKDLEELINKETSIMLTPTGIEETRVSHEDGVTNIFAEGIDPEEETISRSAIGRIAATRPPEKGKLAHAIKTQSEVLQETPNAFKTTKNNRFQKFISDFDSLMEAAHAAENKKYGVNIDEIENPRERALAVVEKEKAEAIDYPAYVVNEKCGDLTLNDLDISLRLNAPFNLNNISAKRLLASKEFPAMVRAGYIKFISPDEVQGYIDRAAAPEVIGELPVFGGKSGSALRFAESEAVNGGPESGYENVGKEIDLEGDEPTEQETLLRVHASAAAPLPPHITRTVPTERSGSRVSQHGSGASVSRPAPASKNPNVKSIRRTGIEFH